LIRFLFLEGLTGDTEVKAGQAYQGLNTKGKWLLRYIGKSRGNDATIDFNQLLPSKIFYFHVLIREIQSFAIGKEV
jgi:hypothetical protein